MNLRNGREAYLGTIAQLTDERSAAEPVVESLRTGTEDVWDVDILPEWRTAGFVQALTAAAATVLETDPARSLALAQLALAIATGIPAGAYPAPIQPQIEGTAWKEIGNAHRYVGEFDASLRAYDSASRAFATANTLAIDEAVIDFARAVVLVDLDRYQEASALLRKIEPLFTAFEDKKRLIQVKALRGNILVRQSRWEDARATYTEALMEVPDSDLYTRSLLYANLGIACTGLGLFNDAAVNLHSARQLLTDLEMPLEVNRCEWNLGRVLLERNEFQKTVPLLRRVRDTFLAKGMREEAGLAGLDMADALIAMRAVDEARVLVSQILTEFTEAKLNSRALTALAYLRDILPQSQRPVEAVRHVRRYLDRLQDEPELLFLPLPE